MIGARQEVPRPAWVAIRIGLLALLLLAASLVIVRDQLLATFPGLAERLGALGLELPPPADGLDQPIPLDQP